MTGLYYRQSVYVATLGLLAIETAVRPGFIAWVDGYGRYSAGPVGVFGIADGYHIIDGQGVQWADDSVFTSSVNLDGYATIIDLQNETDRAIAIENQIITALDGYTNYNLDGYATTISLQNEIDRAIAAENQIKIALDGYTGVSLGDRQEFTTAGSYTWTKPTGYTWCRVTLVGGGAGGNYGGYVGDNAGCGGGAGYVETRLFLMSSLGATVTGSVGAGGTKGLAGTPAGAGENTSFGSFMVLGAPAPTGYNGGADGSAGGGSVQTSNIFTTLSLQGKGTTGSNGSWGATLHYGGNGGCGFNGVPGGLGGTYDSNQGKGGIGYGAGGGGGRAYDTGPIFYAGGGGGGSTGIGVIVAEDGGSNENGTQSGGGVGNQGYVLIECM